MPGPDLLQPARHVWRIPRLSVPATVRGTFLRSSVAVFAGFAVLGLFTAVAPLFLRELIGLTDPAVAGLVVGALFLASTCGQVLALGRLGVRAMQVGCAALALGALVLATALALGSLPLLLAGVALAGTGQGIGFRSALALLSARTPARRRGEVSSSLFVVAYVAISLPIVGEALLAQVAGLRTAGVTFALAVAAVAAVATWAFTTIGRSSMSEPAVRIPC